MKNILIILYFIFIPAITWSFDGDYLIGEEDILRISVWGNPEMTAELPVRPDGKISFHLIGDIKVAGRTPMEVKKIIENELSRYIKAPVVSIMVSEINNYKVYVVKQRSSSPVEAGTREGSTGVIQLKRKTSLLQLLAQVGSLEDIDFRNSSIIREGKKLIVNLSNLLKGDLTQDIILKPGDIILLADNFNNRIKVMGAVRNPSLLSYKEGLTVVDAILQCGGFTEFAKQNDVVVVRREEGRVKKLSVRVGDIMKNGDLEGDLALMPGDIVIVKTGMF
ncbi:MAG: polysaccharide biosynthesis/export family protein [Thermodesulfovibrionales bacterium]|nr:polysaccharide biosynthesis/export family protein [Thermodesulfovibrionales bacterium]